MPVNEKINLFWFRRDLRLEDNTGLSAAMHEGLPVLPIFIFDTSITDDLHPDDPRISFIYESLGIIDKELRRSGSSLVVKKGLPVKVMEELTGTYIINSVFTNSDYEPSTADRDKQVESFLGSKGVNFFSFKDHVIFEKNEIAKPDGTPYTIFTPYRNKWLKTPRQVEDLQQTESTKTGRFHRLSCHFPALEELGFRPSSTRVKPYDLSVIGEYGKYRDLPAADKTTFLGPHLRFGTVSIRKIARFAAEQNSVFLDQLIWREFFMQLLYNFPHVVTENFRKKYDHIRWRNNEQEFERWCNGETGFPMVDAGMRQLNETGYMHNRVRMIAANFLCKHLLTDWRWGEAYFADKLLDYELASNNGNWQWVAGTGCDAARYFRIFNPSFQQKKFDSKNEYVKRWIPELNTSSYPEPMVEQKSARQRAIDSFLNPVD